MIRIGESIPFIGYCCFYLTLTISVSINSLSATTFEVLDTTRLIHATLSTSHLNRIAIDGGRIQKVICPEQNLSVTLEEESGQVFVWPLVDRPRVTTLSVVTTDGYVQDIELSFDDRPSELLVLSETIDCVECDLPLEIEISESDSMVQLVKCVLDGNIPCDFYSCDIRPCTRIVKKGVEARLAAKFVSLHETLFVWTVENTYSRKTNLFEQEMNFQNGNWVFIEKNNLKGKERITAIISVSNNG